LDVVSNEVKDMIGTRRKIFTGKAIVNVVLRMTTATAKMILDLNYILLSSSICGV
jgi:hypothetical protein